MSMKTKIAPPIKPAQQESSRASISLRQTSVLVNAYKARKAFSVYGEGYSVAVIDTGMRTTHYDFKGRVIAQHNFTSENGGDPKDVTDDNGHGTHVAGIVAAENPRRYMGIAPKANVIPLKALPSNGSGSFDDIELALQWVLDNHVQYQITVVCMSLGDDENYTSDANFRSDTLFSKIKALKAKKVAVVVAAGNGFDVHDSEQGMSYPAILHNTISVGAVYDTGQLADQIVPFSQRLHETVNKKTRTDIFAPGAWLTSSGILNDRGTSTMQGTSQATPCIAGISLLLQEYFFKKTGHLPSVDTLIECLRQGGVAINDGDDEDDEVINTGMDYIRADALGALNHATQHILNAFISEHGLLKEAA